MATPTTTEPTTTKPTLRSLWKRYLAWRRADGVPAASLQSSEFVKKIAASDEDITFEATANRGNGWSR